jgi:hypothetical protein
LWHNQKNSAKGLACPVIFANFAAVKPILSNDMDDYHAENFKMIA